ncbi:glycosyltransferase family 2 protein [Streptomyces violaceorubidus]
MIRHETNRGMARPATAVSTRPRGDFVTFLDGDDWYGPGYLTELVRAVEELGCDFARTDHVQATGTERVIRRPPRPPRATS